jgi:hypothetical protein
MKSNSLSIRPLTRCKLPVICRYSTAIVRAVLLLFVLCAPVSGQSDRGNSAKILDRIPDKYRKPLSALGRRAKEKGKERTVYTGQLFDKKGKASTARIIHQLPNLVRLEGFKSGNASISFDGERAYGANSREEEGYLETFAMDMAEGMLASIQASAAIRLLGEGFGPDPLLEPDYSGQRFDIYDVTDVVRCRRNPLLRARYYYLDSRTGLLLKTTCHDQSTKPAVAMETLFSLWGTIDGSAYPARIDHYEGGELEFTFIAEQITSEPSTDAVNFR